MLIQPRVRAAARKSGWLVAAVTLGALVVLQLIEPSSVDNDLAGASSETRMEFLGGEVAGAALAVENDVTMDCAEVEGYAGFSMLYAEPQLMAEYDALCYIEGYHHAGSPPDLHYEDQLPPEMREGWEAHVLYLPQDLALSVQDATYEELLDAGAIDLAMVPGPVYEESLGTSAVAEIPQVNPNAPEILAGLRRGSVRTRPVGAAMAVVQRLRPDRAFAAIPIRASHGGAVVLHVSGNVSDAFMNSILDSLGPGLTSER